MKLYNVKRCVILEEGLATNGISAIVVWSKTQDFRVKFTN